MKLTLFGIFYLLLYLYYIPTYWRIFNKLGRKGWEGIIPFYNHYIFFKEMWESRFFWIDIFSVIFSAIFATAYSFTDFAGYNLGVLLFDTIHLIIQFMICAKIARTFGKGTFFGVALCFFPFVCYPILAFGKAMPIKTDSEMYR